MTIENLVKVVPPPAEPDEPYLGSWDTIEAELGTALPQDYKDFVRLYGNGNFMDLLGVHVPRCRSPYVRLESEVRAICDLLRHFDDVPYSLWPEPGGLLPFGKTDFSDYLCWFPHGAPSDWTVVVVGDRGTMGCEAFDCDLTDFLAGLADGTITPKEFPEDLLACDFLFRPNSYWPPRGYGFAWRVRIDDRRLTASWNWQAQMSAGSGEP